MSTNNAQPLSFTTKVDVWAILVLGTASLVMLLSAIERARDAVSLGQVVGAFAGPLLVSGIVALVAIPTRYECHATELVIRSGILRYRVPYSDIQKVVPSHNVLAAPAWSLDRLKIVREFGYLLVSPRDKRAFIEVLAKHAPQLTVEGDSLVPRTTATL